MSSLGELYVKFCEVRSKEKLTPLSVNKRHFSLKIPETDDKKWLLYIQYLQEFNREIANEIMRLWEYVHNIRCWTKVFEDEELDEDYNWLAIREFVEPQATLALNLPSAIKQRFIYAATHLNHQANIATVKGYKDDIPSDRELKSKHANKTGANWKKYTKFEQTVKKISNDDYENKIRDFRNRYHHKSPRRINIGYTTRIERTFKEGKATYKYYDDPPIKISEIVEILLPQIEQCEKAYEKFHDLIREQVSRM